MEELKERIKKYIKIAMTGHKLALRNEDAGRVAYERGRIDAYQRVLDCISDTAEDGFADHLN